MGRRTRTQESEFPQLEAEGLEPVPIKGDGNCLFNAFSHQLFGDETHHAEIREAVVAFIRSHSERFKAFVSVDDDVRRAPRRRGRNLAGGDPSITPTQAQLDAAFEKRLKKAGQGGEWGDHLEIQAFAGAYEVDVKVWQRDFALVSSFDEGTPSKTVHVAYHDWAHYSSVRPKGDNVQGRPDVDGALLARALKQKGDPAPLEEKVEGWDLDVKAVRASASPSASATKAAAAEAAVAQLLHEKRTPSASTTGSSSKRGRDTADEEEEEEDDSDDDDWEVAAPASKRQDRRSQSPLPRPPHSPLTPIPARPRQHIPARERKLLQKQLQKASRKAREQQQEAAPLPTATLAIRTSGVPVGGVASSGGPRPSGARAVQTR